MSAHALLSASGAHRWLNCPPSARLEEQFPDTTSAFAAEGSLAHEIAELKLRKYFTPTGPQKFGAALRQLKQKEHYDPEMLTHTDTYLDYVQKVSHSYNSSPYVVIEKRLDYSHVVPEGFGTGDCIIIGGAVLHVIDFKYGKGVQVEATDNPQMMLYALGALKAYSLLYRIEKVVLTIVQPRLNHTSEFEIDASALTSWGDSIKPTAQMAFQGKGDYCSGEWCKFCRAKAQCRARAGAMTALEAFSHKAPALLTENEIGDLLERAILLKSWASDLEEHALSQLLAGKEIPGWKAVAGRSNRKFANTDKAFETLIADGIEKDLLYQRKPITLTAVEKLIGKPKFKELLTGYVIKPPGKPTIAPMSDKREAITTQPTAEEAFSKVS